MGGASFEEDELARTLVLVGKTGNGKSSTCNSIIGREAFKSEMSSAGVTTTCEMQSTVQNNRGINVIDTPGLFDFSVEEEHIEREFAKCVHMAKDGIHAVVVVFSVRNRFSQEEDGVIERLRKLFGNKITDYMIVVFTGGDDLGKKPLEDYLRGCPQPLQETLRKCGNRYLLFDNRTENAARKSQQLQELLLLVDVVVNNNDGKPYTKELFAEVKKHQTGDGGVDNFLGSSRKDMPEFKEQLKIAQKMVELKLRTTIRWLEEHAARLKAEAEAKLKMLQKKSDKEIRVLRHNLERARNEVEHDINRRSSCAIM